MADWTDQVADAIDNAVGTVRDKTVVPAEKVVRAVTGGLLAGLLGAAAAVLGALGAFRGLSLLVSEEVWVAHLILAGIFTGAGLFCLSRR
ncbi:MAG: hypothetical protein ACRDY7_11485 [Acidimicrobiia bacterium]